MLQVQKAMDAHQWEEAVKLRGHSFQRNLETYRLLAKLRIPEEHDNLSEGIRFNFAVINVGAPAGGKLSFFLILSSFLFCFGHVFGLPELIDPVFLPTNCFISDEVSGIFVFYCFSCLKNLLVRL